MKKNAVLLFILFFLISGALPAQEAVLDGPDICSDGLMTSRIVLRGMNPDKYYALYHDSKLLQMRKSADPSQGNSMIFGDFKEPGIYTAASFDKVVTGFPEDQGTAVKGRIVISESPVIFGADTLRIKSGQPVNLLPKTNLPETEFSWVSKTEKGVVKGITRKGNGAVRDVLTVEGNITAMVIYTITPYKNLNGITCSGSPRDFVVLISPPE